MLLKGKEEINLVSQPVEALEILIIRLAYSCKLPSLETVVNQIQKDKSKDNNFDIKDTDIGTDIKKILEIFPDSKIIEN